MLNQLQGVKKWLQKELKLAQLKRSNIVSISLLTIFWIIEVIWLYVPNSYEQTITFIVVIQYLLIFLSVLNLNTLNKYLYYPFAIYYIYTLGVEGSKSYMPSAQAFVTDYIAVIGCMVVFFWMAIQDLKESNDKVKNS